MIPKYNGWASLVLLGKTQTNKQNKQTKQKKPPQAEPKNVIIYYKGGKKCPTESLLGDNPSKVFKPSKTSWYYAHKDNSSALEKGEGLMWQKRSNWNLSSLLGRNLHIVNVWDAGFFLNEKTQELLRITDQKQGDIWAVGILNVASWRCSRTSTLSSPPNYYTFAAKKPTH